MACYAEISSAANTIKKFHTKSDLYYGYIYNFYHDKQDNIDNLFYQHHLTLLKDIDHHSLSLKMEKQY